MLKDILSRQIENYIRETDVCKYISLNEDFSISFLAQGEYNINFIVEDFQNKYVFRVNTKSQLGLEKQIQYEYNALKRLEKSGVTSKVYYVDGSKKNLEYGVLIMQYLKGNPLDYGKDLYKAANIFGKIHSIETTKEDLKNFIVEDKLFSSRIEEASKLLNNFWENPLIDKPTKDFFYKFMNWCKKNSYKEKYFIENPLMVINNTEVNSHNFIIGEKDYYLIDWEKPVISDPCQDLTQFLAPTTTLWKTDYVLNQEEINKFFHTYEKVFPGKNVRERVDMYTPYLYLRALGWCAYAYLEYQNPNKEIKNEDTYKKIKQYLDIDFMEKLLNRWF